MNRKETVNRFGLHSTAADGYPFLKGATNEKNVETVLGGDIQGIRISDYKVQNVYVLELYVVSAKKWFGYEVEFLFFSEKSRNLALRWAYGELGHNTNLMYRTRRIDSDFAPEMVTIRQTRHPYGEHSVEGIDSEIFFDGLSRTVRVCGRGVEGDKVFDRTTSTRTLPVALWKKIKGEVFERTTIVSREKDFFGIVSKYGRTSECETLFFR